jgi:hypothetical protein
MSHISSSEICRYVDLPEYAEAEILPTPPQNSSEQSTSSKEMIKVGKLSINGLSYWMLTEAGNAIREV